MAMQSSIKKALNTSFHQLVWGYLKWLIVVVAVAYGLSGSYKLERDTIGVVTRFGKVVEENVPPGLHYKLPWPIDNIHRVSVKEVKTLEIRDFGSLYRLKEGGRSYDFYNTTGLEPYCITGDNNIVAISLVIKYTLDDPVNYLFSMKEPERFLERTASNLIIHHLASSRIDEVLTTGKKQLEFSLQKELIHLLDKHESGMRVSFLEIREVKPPKKVQDSFDRVINAGVNKRKTLNEAQGYYNRVVPEARSEADRIIQEARGYKREKILTAEGETSRFLARLEGYSENPAAHKEKLYLDFVKTLYPKLGEVRVIDSESDNTPVFIPFADTQ